MRWVTPTVAGPSATAGPDSLTAADPDAAAADLVAYLEHVGVPFERQDRVMPVPFRHSEHTH